MNFVTRTLGVDTYPVEQAPTAQTLPSTFTMPSGVYTFNGVDYNCTGKGAYTFWGPLVNLTERRVVYEGDIWALMASLAKLSINGSGEETMSDANKTEYAKSSTIRALCERTIEWVISVCNAEGLTCRKVKALTDGVPTGYYDGHVMVEVVIDGEWRLFDISNNVSFLDEADNLLSLKDALPLTSVSKLGVISKNEVCSYEPAGASGFDTSAWRDTTMYTDALVRKEMERVIRIPGVSDPDGHTYFYIPAGANDVTSYITGTSAAWHVMDEASWLAKYYPSE